MADVVVLDDVLDIAGTDLIPVERLCFLFELKFHF